MTRKNHKYALHAKRRIRLNGENFTVTPCLDKESINIRRMVKRIEELADTYPKWFLHTLEEIRRGE